MHMEIQCLLERLEELSEERKQKEEQLKILRRETEKQETIRLQDQYEKEGNAEALTQPQKIELIQLYAKQIRQLDTEIAIARK